MPHLMNENKTEDQSEGQQACNVISWRLAQDLKSAKVLQSVKESSLGLKGFFPTKNITKTKARTI